MKSLIQKLTSTNASVASLLLRVPVGIILTAHGGQKLYGWFGGYGLEGTGKWLASVGIEPGYLMALLAATVALAIQGGGTLSVDRIIGQKV